MIIYLVIYFILTSVRAGMQKLISNLFVQTEIVKPLVSRIRWQGKQIILQGSHGITLGINVNGKPHDLAVASEQLHFKSNRHDLGLEDASEMVIQAPDTHALK